MNIVHLQLGGGPGGIAILTRDMNLISKHKNIFFFLFEGGAIADEIAENAKVHVENASHKAYLSAPAKFCRFCRENDADIIILHSPAPLAVFCALYANRKLKSTRLFVYWHSNWHKLEKETLDYRARKLIVKTAYNKCEKAIAISKSVKASHIKNLKLKNDKITVNYNGIDCSKFYSDRLEKSDGIFNIIYVGRVYYAKGIHLLVNAVNLLDEQTKSGIHIKIVGSDHGGFTEKMINESEKLGLDGIIEFTGTRLDVPELLANSDLFVHPAICEEGFGITLAEAMAAYVPCIAFNKGAIPEVIDDGINGFIVKKVSAETLAKSIEEAYTIFKSDGERYMQLRNNARAKAEKFTIEESTKTLEELY